MFTSTRFNYRNYTLAAIITTVMAGITIFLSYYIGNDDLFLLLNANLGKASDLFFKYGTHAGDGLLWIVWLVAILKTKRKHLLPLIISAFLLSTIFTQIGKQLIYPEELRPSEAIKNFSLNIKVSDHLKSVNGVDVTTKQDVFKQISPLKKGDSLVVAYERDGRADTVRMQLKKEVPFHFVEGVDVHTYSSFPSGHTATAFTFAFLIALLIRSAGLSLLCLLAALLVGYSRIYIGQHYPLDVGAGMLVAVVSVTLSIIIQHGFYRRRQAKHKQVNG